MKNILITGGSGLIGSYLSGMLKDRGYRVVLLGRNRNLKSEFPVFSWDPATGSIDREAIADADVIIHLAGSSIGKGRWTDRKKREIRDSRVNAGMLIYETLQKNRNNLEAYISASATGYYGTVTSDQIFSENDPPADDYLGEICKQWEQVADNFTNSGIRTVKIRTGIVLSDQGSALQKMAIPVKLGIGAAIGNGKQYMPWIHIKDLCRIYLQAIEDPGMTGAYNAVAPDYKTNKEFTRLVGMVVNRPVWLPGIPGFVMRLIFGEKSRILLHGSRISSDRIKNTGFQFLYPDLEGALNNLVR